MPINRLLEELKAMFSHRQNKVVMRKQFEDRTWRRGEAFSEYLHDKVILANHVPMMRFLITSSTVYRLLKRSVFELEDSRAALLVGDSTIKIPGRRSTDGSRRVTDVTIVASEVTLVRGVRPRVAV